MSEQFRDDINIKGDIDKVFREMIDATSDHSLEDTVKVMMSMQSALLSIIVREVAALRVMMEQK